MRELTSLAWRRSAKFDTSRRSNHTTIGRPASRTTTMAPRTDPRKDGVFGMLLIVYPRVFRGGPPWLPVLTRELNEAVVRRKFERADCHGRQIGPLALAESALAFIRRPRHQDPLDRLSRNRPSAWP